MSIPRSLRHSIEPLEARIAPAAVIDGIFKTGQVGSVIDLRAGEGLATSEGAGSYLLFVEKGRALVFTTDLNNNGQLDYNEITGIAAGDGLRLISFVDIHGDIVTNLKADGFLSDSDANAANDPPALGGDGRLLLNSRIEKIELRSLTVDDIRDVNGDGVVNELDLNTRFVQSSYSIHGNIYAGGGFGAEDGGLIIDTAGFELQVAFFFGGAAIDYIPPEMQLRPSVGSIKIGTTANGDFFSFGSSNRPDTWGYFVPFVPQPGTKGGSIEGIRAALPEMTFNIGSLEAGGGGVGAAGGDIRDVTLNGDLTGGYLIIAGDGGRGPNGGNGGNIENISDLSSLGSLIIVKSGDGGQGVTGSGGQGGSISLGEFRVSGGINLILGNGGDGFINGGNGTSFNRGTVVGVDIPPAIPIQLVGSQHTPYTIGSRTPIDFDGDGISDYVFTTSDPGQLVVSFGSADGGFRSFVDENGVLRLDRFYLDGFFDAEALTVGDFNGDGRPDIAVASNLLGSYGGIKVFLSEFADLDGDGTQETFTGFSRGIHSPLPALATFNGSETLGLTRSPNAISDIAAGDFDGDGIVDLAVSATYFAVLDGALTRQILIVMKGDAEALSPGGTGRFYADFGTAGNTRLPFALLGDGLRGVIEATSLTASGASFDVVIAGVSSENASQNFVDIYNFSGVAPLLSPVIFGDVDTNREIGPDRISPSRAFFLDFTVLDFDGDGNADVVGLIKEPPNFLVAVQGNGTTIQTIASKVGDNAGILLASPGLDLGSQFVALKSGNFDGNPATDEVALLNYTSPPDFAWVVDTLAIQITTSPADEGASIVGGFSSLVDAEKVASIVAFDIFASGPSVHGVGVGLPITDLFANEIALPTSSVFDVTVEYTINIIAGDGGNALVGRGGRGGSLGGALNQGGILPDGTRTDDVIGDLSVFFTPDPALATTVQFIAGLGGNGFTQGGVGGNVTGVSLRALSPLDAAVGAYGGHGGFGVSGSGGAGGNIANVSLIGALEFVAGNGGTGTRGGKGGDILGNNRDISGIPVSDTDTGLLFLKAGDGGAGTKGGGDGGSIRDMAPRFNVRTLGVSPFAMFQALAGDGGGSITGKGGNGGSITNIAPLADINFFDDEIYFQAGHGGDGVSGGAGGSVSRFINLPTTQDIPSIVSFIAGDGGTGTSGKGGKGGGVSQITVSATGNGSSFGPLDISPINPPPVSTLEPSAYTFNRFLAGNGGGSSGNIGGKGGDVSSLQHGTASGAIAVVAGAGGTGLIAGGGGGSVRSNSIASGDPQPGNPTGPKLLVIAGAGGDATGFLPNPNDPADLNIPLKAVGGKIGKGGNGGSIIGLTQTNSINVSVDLIAGNGGDSANYGTNLDNRNFVGKGGSIQNVNARGSIGNVDAARPILSYNDLGAGETLTQWVSSYLRAEISAGPLNDSVGNVGIVVGGAGRVKAIQTVSGDFETQPAPGGVKLNGTLSNLTARLLMSAVAGDVNRIAAINNARDINITSGLVGADKEPLGPIPQYLSVTGTIVPTPQLGGGLIDGAFISSNRLANLDGKPRVFVL
jgi:hypothetical protein